MIDHNILNFLWVSGYGLSLDSQPKLLSLKTGQIFVLMRASTNSFAGLAVVERKKLSSYRNWLNDG